MGGKSSNKKREVDSIESRRKCPINSLSLYSKNIQYAKITNVPSGRISSTKKNMVHAYCTICSTEKSVFASKLYEDKLY